jgi:hypothetical protein
MIHRSAAEDREIIHLVRHSDLSITKTCTELSVACSPVRIGGWGTFFRKDTGTLYRWYSSYQERGIKGLVDRKSKPQQSCLPWQARPGELDPCSGQRSDHGTGSCLSREIPPADGMAFQLSSGHLISESGVYGILQDFDLMQSPLYQMVRAGEKFGKTTRRAHELCKTGFTQFKVFNH